MSNAASTEQKISALLLNPLSFNEPLTEKVVQYIPIKKPKDYFCRVSVDPKYRAFVSIIKVRKENSETVYLLDPKLVPYAVGVKIHVVEVLVCVTNKGVHFLWLITVPIEKKTSSWTLSERACAEAGEKDWIKITANTDAGSWDTIFAKSDLGVPSWPTQSLAELLDKAFKDRIIDSLDHEILKDARGEI